MQLPRIAYGIIGSIDNLKTVAPNHGCGIIYDRTNPQNLIHRQFVFISIVPLIDIISIISE